MQQSYVGTDTRAAVTELTDQLKDKPHGTFFSFEDLEKIAGEDVRTPKGRGILVTTSRRLIKYYERVLVNVRGKGYKIALHNEVSRIAFDDRKIAKRKINRAGEKLNTVDLSNLNSTELDAFLREQAKNSILTNVNKALDSKQISNKKTDDLYILSDGQLRSLITKKL